MDYDKTGKAFRYLVEHLNSSDGKRELKKFLQLISEALKGIERENRDSFTTKIVNLFWSIVEKRYEAVIVILKNKNELYDVFIFDDKVELPMISLVSSEAFEDMLRRNPLKGSVIENIDADDIIIFLKAYYISREEPNISSTALNLVNEYSPDCLEISSIQEKFVRFDPMKKLELKNIILYDKEVLPYSLSYLNEYRDSTIKDRGTGHYALRSAINEVTRDRFLGMSVQKYRQR